jgi:hypothetical protein
MVNISISCEQRHQWPNGLLYHEDISSKFFRDVHNLLRNNAASTRHNAVMLKLSKFTSHRIHNLDILRGESAMRRNAPVSLRRNASFTLRSVTALHCRLLLRQIRRLCVVTFRGFRGLNILQLTKYSRLHETREIEGSGALTPNYLKRQI